MAGTNALAKGLETLLTPVVEECDRHVEKVLASQEQLTAQIERLTKIMHEIQEATPSSTVTKQAHTLVAIRNRVAALAELVQTVQARLTRMQAMKASLPEPPAPFLLQQLNTIPTNADAS
uniref:Biogenesis of lysosome-related organelles complex 1 subunit 7 n=1 Tax=Pyramimonas obovata TaxID=1411642 RepID=A0A7S0N8A2_9CHLO|mmetsp:Transcript_22771/g.49920  ORF Transcript_22771/g.49920 Transcript_22771/m.49920 type:complete len:120 (+) Transcript_22771:244-603(+)|eukprot:CAMPEP_0118932626 /NCGR_PEP_ID=MMETSP1169-20130426/10535_1 /TAXON_ID=36882 /ORGANISM="Pyramimonas obovata, Strain CCMP722" /LENGTH=119 /DNA_ID=CAMNT_0006875315 /DNA_START=200 /DNA_END=559 /DNA_ORIENTATION=-